MPHRAQPICRVIAAILMIVLLASCQTQPAADPAPTLAANRLWDPNPETVIFQADVTGSAVPELAFLNETPLCTVYGDNRVVWVNELDAFNTQVLFDYLPNDRLENFFGHLIFNENLLDYGALATLPADGQNAPVVETLYINFGGETHHADNYSGWSVDYFNRILNICRHLSSTPILFEPNEAWITVREMPILPDAPFILWRPEERGGISLADIVSSGGSQWVRGSAVTELWRELHRLPYTITYGEGDKGYQIAVQVPGITRNAPPAPDAQPS